MEIKVEKDLITGDLLIPLGEELCKQMDWQIGDTILWKDLGNGSWSISKVKPAEEPKIYLSCGHAVATFNDSYDVLVKTTDEEDRRAVSVERICVDCLDKYERLDVLLESEDEAFYWLNND